MRNNNPQQQKAFQHSATKHSIKNIDVNINIKRNKNDLKWKLTVKFLGVRSDRKLKWTPHTKQTIGKIQSRTIQIYQLVARNSRLNIRNKLTFNKIFILSKITYASVTTRQIYEANMKLLETQQNKLTNQKKVRILNKIKIVKILQQPMF